MDAQLFKRPFELKMESRQQPALRQYLHQTLPNRRMGKSAPTLWPLRLPDLTLWYSLLGQCLRTFVDVEPHTTIKELKNKFRQSIQTFDENALDSVYQTIEHCL